MSLSCSLLPPSTHQVLAEASLPLDQHLALLMATSGDDDSPPREESEPQAAPRRTGGPANPPPPTFSRASNRKLIRNALCHVCLAGASRAKEKDAVLQALNEYKVRPFLLYVPL